MALDYLYGCLTAAMQAQVQEERFTQTRKRKHKDKNVLVPVRLRYACACVKTMLQKTLTIQSIYLVFAFNLQRLS